MSTLHVVLAVAYVNAFEFGPRGFLLLLLRGEFQFPKFFLQSDLRRRADSR